MEALTLLLQLIVGIITWFFNAEILPGVTLGWVFLSVVIIAFLINTFLLNGGNKDA